MDSLDGNVTNFTNTLIRTTAFDNYIAGTCFLLTAIWGLLGYGFVLPAIASSKDLRHPCYATIFSMGLSDSASLFAWIVIGIHTVSQGSLLPHALIQHSLCVLVAGWGSLSVHIGVLGVNRYVAICHTGCHDRLFSRRRLCFIFAGCWIYAIFVHALPTFLPPNMDYTLDGYVAYWDNKAISDYYFYEDISWCLSIFMLNFACYTAIILRYRSVRRQLNIMTSSTVAARMRQFRLALQCLIRCCTFFFYDLLYYVIGYITSNIWLTYICSTYLWAFNNAMSPWVYLAFDRQLRTVIMRWFVSKAKMNGTTQRVASTAVCTKAPLGVGNRVAPMAPTEGPKAA